MVWICRLLPSIVLICCCGCKDKALPVSRNAMQGQPLALGSSTGSSQIIVAPSVADADAAVNPFLTADAELIAAGGESSAEAWERYASAAGGFVARDADIRFAYAKLATKSGQKLTPLETHLKAGIELLNQGHLPEAGEKFELAQLADPSDFRGFFFEAVCRAQLDDLPRAAKTLDLAISRAPNETELYLHRGNIRMRRREYAAAVDDFSKVLIAQPQNLAALINRAAANFHRRRPKDIIADTTAVIELRQDIPDAYLLRALGNIMIGEPARARRDYDASVAAGLAKEAAESWRSLFYGRS